ncbi:MAG TPA: hypothetical protein VJJ80_00615 [Patescibacteria group bacterium]|nr:hypothetical protein [Patescibacteria group bacterium]
MATGLFPNLGAIRAHLGRPAFGAIGLEPIEPSAVEEILNSPGFYSLPLPPEKERARLLEELGKKGEVYKAVMAHNKIILVQVMEAEEGLECRVLTPGTINLVREWCLPNGSTIELHHLAVD